MYVNGSYRSEFKDVYEGYHLEIQVVDHCNLNCSGCNHFSPLANKWFMSVEEFVENLVLVSQKLPSISTLMILGGEPTLHPQLGDLCMLARTIFPTIPITILTNGVALKDWTQEQYETLEQYRVALGVSKYYGQDYEWMSAARAQHPDIFANVSPARFVFESDLVNENGTEDGEDNFHNCSKHKLPCFTVKDKKIFICPFSAHIVHFCNKFGVDIPLTPQDYLDLTADVGLDDLHRFCYEAKPICNYCRKGNPNIWTKANYLKDDYTLSNKELFLHNYDLHQTKVTNTIYRDMILDELHEDIDPNYSQHFEKSLMSRFKTGEIDIIIPFYKESPEVMIRCRDSILSQTIVDKCNVYLISDGSPNEADAYDIFSNPTLHTFFFKTETNSGPGAARNIGLDNSFAPFVFFLDMDDYLYQENGLEVLLSEINSIPGANMVYSLDWEERSNASSDFGHGCLYRKSFIDEHNIRFGLQYTYEDAYFQNSALLCGLEYNRISFVSYYYSKNPNPIIAGDKLQHLILGSWSHFTSVLKYGRPDNQIRSLDMLNQYINLMHNAYNHDKLMSLSNEEFAMFVAYLVFLWRIVLAQQPHLLQGFQQLKLEEVNIYQHIMDENFYHDCGFESPTGDFMQDMKQFILTNPVFNKILLEGKLQVLDLV